MVIVSIVIHVCLGFYSVYCTTFLLSNRIFFSKEMPVWTPREWSFRIDIPVLFFLCGKTCVKWLLSTTCVRVRVGFCRGWYLLLTIKKNYKIKVIRGKLYNKIYQDKVRLLSRRLFSMRFFLLLSSPCRRWGRSLSLSHSYQERFCHLVFFDCVCTIPITINITNTLQKE